MLALIVVSVIAAVEAVVIVVGRAKFELELQSERQKVATWLDSLPKKAEAAVRREAEILKADIKKKV